MTFCPSARPCSAKPLRNASTKWALSLADRALRNPITGLSAGCAPAASGQTTEPTKTLMKLRRRISRLPRLPTNILQGHARGLKASVHVRFGSKADSCSATAHVRYGPKADVGDSPISPEVAHVDQNRRAPHFVFDVFSNSPTPAKIDQAANTTLTS